MIPDFAELRLWAEAHLQTGCTRSRQVLALLARVAELERLTTSLTERVAQQSELLSQRAMKEPAHDATRVDRGTQPGSDPGLPEHNHAPYGDGTCEGVSDGTGTTVTGSSCPCSNRAAEAEAGATARFDGNTPLTSTVAGWRSKAGTNEGSQP